MRPAPSVAGANGQMRVIGPVARGCVIYSDRAVRIYTVESAKAGESARVEINSHAVLA